VNANFEELKPDYERGNVRLYCGDALIVGHKIRVQCAPGRRVHSIGDPPYSARVHGEARKVMENLPDGANRRVELGFGHLTPELRRGLAELYWKHTTGFCVVFGDCEPESILGWKKALETFCLHYHKLGVWNKPDSTPRMSGDAPADGWEAVHIGGDVGFFQEEWDAIHIARATAKGSGHPRWNGKGKRNVWTHGICRGEEDRVSETPKPTSLMIEIVQDFTKRGDGIVDFTMGGGTTIIGCLRAEGGDRFAVGIEKRPEMFEKAMKRIDAELSGSTRIATASGQSSLFK